MTSPAASDPSCDSKPANSRWVRRRNHLVVPAVGAQAASLSATDLSAAVKANDVARLTAHLRAEQQQSRALAAADSFSHLLQEAAAILQDASSPPQLTLDLLAHDRLQRSRGDKIDLQYMLLRGLQEQQQRDADDGHSSSASSSSPSSSLCISPSLLARAQALLDSLLLSPRATDLLISTFRIRLSDAERWQHIARLSAAASPREAAELAIRLQVLPSASDSQHEQLLRPLITRDGAQVDTLHHYIAALPEDGGVRQRWLQWLINTMAEEEGGDNVTVAMRLLAHYRLPLTDFPRVEHLKRRHELWWMTRMGKSDEFAELIVGDDVRLQRRLIQHLSRDRYAGDRDRMQRWIQRWQLQDDDTVQRVVAAMPAAASQPPQPQDEQAEQQLPLFTMPHTDIVFVSSLAAIDAASAALLPASRHAVLGFDCEFIPESFLQLGVVPSHCQLLQVATQSQAFLFDLLLLSPPSPPATGQALSELLVSLLSCDAVKLGMGFREDVRKLRREFPHFACFQVTIPRYADLLPLLRDRPLGQQPGKEAGEKKERKARGNQAARRAKLWRAKQGPEQAEQQQQQANGEELKLPSDSEQAELKDAPAVAETAADGDAADEEADVSACQPAAASSAASSSSSSFTPYVPKDGGLAKLCRQFLGRRLDKSCQISHWARRPLTAQQLQYAACDAFVQLLIHAEAASRGITLSMTDIEG